MAQTATNKKGVVTGIVAVTIQCPDCGGYCQNESGSTMIEDGDKISCISCHNSYSIPATAFKVPLPKSSIKANVRSYVKKRWSIHRFIGSTDVDWRGLTHEVISHVPHPGIDNQQMASWVQEFGKQFQKQYIDKQDAKETNDWYQQHLLRTYGTTK